MVTICKVMVFSRLPVGDTVRVTDNGMLCNASGRAGFAKFLLRQTLGPRGSEDVARSACHLLARGAGADSGGVRICRAVPAALSGRCAARGGPDARPAGRDRLAAGHAQYFG